MGVSSRARYSCTVREADAETEPAREQRQVTTETETARDEATARERANTRATAERQMQRASGVRQTQSTEVV